MKTKNKFTRVYRCSLPCKLPRANNDFSVARIAHFVRGDFRQFIACKYSHAVRLQECRGIPIILIVAHWRILAMTGSMCTLSVIALALAIPVVRKAPSIGATESQEAIVSLH
jgi:hypothetical protein